MLTRRHARAPHHCTSGNIQVGYIGPSAVQSDLAPSDFHLFLHLKKHLAGKKFNDDDEVQEEVMTWFKALAANFYESGIHSWFQDLRNVWTMSATMLKNKVMYRQFTDSVAFGN